MLLFTCKCPICSSENIRHDYVYGTIANGYREMLFCRDCASSFSETKNTFLQGIRTPVSKIWKVLKARTEGTSLNATCRVFDIAKNTLLAWERKFTNLYHHLFIYSMAHTFIQSVIEAYISHCWRIIFYFIWNDACRFILLPSCFLKLPPVIC